MTVDRDLLELQTEYRGASTPIEERVAAIWRQAMDIDPVGLDDNFFDLNGDSLSAELIAAAISSELGVELAPSRIMVLDTPAKMASELAGSGNDSLAQPDPKAASGILVALNDETDGTPAFLIHGESGYIFPRREYLDALGRRPLYGFWARGVGGNSEPLDSVEEIASLYLGAMLKVRPEGPWHLISVCAGNWIASEMILQMHQMGRAPERVIMLDDTHVPPGEKGDYRIRRSRIAQANIPLVSPLAIRARKFGTSLASRIRFLIRTGHFVDGYTAEGRRLPGVEEFFLARARARHQRLQKRSEAFARNGAQAAELSETSPPEIESAALATARLQRAFVSYSPVPVDFPVDIIASTARKTEFSRRDHPLGRLLPRHRIIWSGDDHIAAVSSIETAHTISALLDS